MEPILELKRVKKAYKDFELDDINISLPRGVIMGFIGPNGAGKTTTIKLIMNLIKKDSGEIRVFGKDHLDHEQEIKDLSKGMRMKFSLTIALSHYAELLIMDEPTSGLDPVVRNELLDIFSQFIQDEGKSILFSTHITTDLDKIADYIVFIDQGKIILHSVKDEIIEKYGMVKGSNDLLDPDTKKLFIGMKQHDYGFEGLTNDRNKAREVFGENVVIERPTLEDVMIYHTGRNTE